MVSFQTQVSTLFLIPHYLYFVLFYLYFNLTIKMRVHSFSQISLLFSLLCGEVKRGKHFPSEYRGSYGD